MHAILVLVTMVQFSDSERFGENVLYIIADDKRVLSLTKRAMSEEGGKV